MKIMQELNIADIKLLCRTNQYINKICHQKDFWHNKLLNDHLPIPDSFKNLQGVNWIKVYDIINNINNILFFRGNDYKIGVKLNVINPTYYMNLIKKYDINIDSEVYGGHVYKMALDKYEGSFGIAIQVNNYIIQGYDLSSHQVFNFLFDAMLSDAILTLNIK